MNAVQHGDRNGISAMSHVHAVVVTLILLGSQLVTPAAMADSPAPPKPESQATVKRLESGINRITLLPKAASRLDITTAQIRKDAMGRRFAPFSSIIYDVDGVAWVYKVSTQLSFARERVVIELIIGDYAYLQEGPPAGTQVVTLGVPELYGTEVGVNGE